MIDINAQYLDDCRMEAIRGASAEEMYGKLLSVLDETACGEN